MSLNAWFFTTSVGYVNRAARNHKAAAFGGITADNVVEIGAGSEKAGWIALIKKTLAEGWTVRGR